MIKIAICDDEPLLQEQLARELSAILVPLGQTFTADYFSNGLKLLASPLNYDLVFLDIRMPGPNGITLAQTLRSRKFQGALIFVTAFMEHMPDAFEVEATDYLVKPIQPKRLEGALMRAIKRLKEQSGKSLFIQTMNWCKTVKFGQIYYAEVINRKIYLHTRDGVIEYYGKMKELEPQLSPHFIQCHRSYLINPDYLTEYADGMITLENHAQIPVSRKYHPILMKRMMEYMGRQD
ncbi:MAG: response regulator transcription factor [Lachnospiraceae bacterium]|jgi:DNA-binding LytR/AlgR family response regulator|nr:response regulator transcription factor [Lachnospiraceae bacterium]